MNAFDFICWASKRLLLSTLQVMYVAPLVLFGLATGAAHALTATSTTVTLSTPTVNVGQLTTLTATVSPSAATGTVTFKDGTVTLGVGTLSAGVAKLGTSFSTVTSHSITGVYYGSTVYASSTSAAKAQAVTAIATTTALTASPVNVTVGQGTTLTATVTPSAATGTVTFKDGAASLGIGTIASGVAKLSTTFGTTGTHALSAVYYGAPTYSSSTSTAVNETVNPLTATSTTLAVSTTTVSVGQPMTVTATVSPSVSTGTVTFMDAAATIGTGKLSSGKASLTTSFSASGSHSLTAVYGSVPPYATSTSTASVVKVMASPLSSLTVSSLSSTTAQTVTLTVSVSPSNATGTVTFKDAGVSLGVVSLSTGFAKLAKRFTTAGLHVLTATYAGDTYNLPSTTPAVNFAVNGVPGTIPNPPVSPAPVVSQAYDTQGNHVAVTIAPSVAGFSFTTATNYDALNRAVKVTDAANGTTQRTYDGADQVKTVTDPKTLTTQYNRDGLGQTTQLVSPDTGAAGMTYDAGGNLLTRTDSRGVIAQYSYDALNRITGTTYSQAGSTSQSYTWAYDQTGGMFTNGIGRLTSITYPAGSNSFAYDSLGHLTSTRQVISPNASGNPTAVVQYTTYTFDSAGHLASMVYPSGRTLSFTYANGVLTGLSLAKDSVSAATPLITNLQYAPFGGPKSWNWVMNDGVNGGTVAHSRSFDANGRLIRYPLGEHLRDVTYDAAGRITSYTHYVAASGSTAPAQDQQFNYDALERLVQATTSQASWSYTYDANGNRTSVRINNGAPSAYTVAATSNRLTSIDSPALTLTHDVMGNIVSDGTYTLTYDLRGRLTTATQGSITTTYAYDNNGQRIRKYNNQGAANTVLFVYDQSGQLLGEYDSTGTAIREYVWLGSMPVSMFTPDPAQGVNANTAPPLIYFIHADHINTPRVLVDKTNMMRWRWMGEPFGTQAPETSPGGLAALTFNLRFPGQYYDLENGIFYNAQRDYIPGIGRYAQSDPIGLKGGINTYSYVGSAPLNRIDPTGLDWFTGWWNASLAGFQSDSASDTILRILKGTPQDAALLSMLSIASKASAAASCTFRTAHYAPRLETAGVNVANAESSVAKVINGMASNMVEGGDVVGRLHVNNVWLEFRARLLSNNLISVGTIFPVK